jgi:hypothetical protein
MFRPATGILAATAVPLFITAIGAAPPTALNPGDKFEGEIGDTQKKYTYPRQLPNGQRASLSGLARGYSAEVPITLAARQSITITATVSGTGRSAAVVLLDPTGKAVAGAPERQTTCRLKVDEVSTAGEYTIVVVSNHVGVFTLRTEGSADDLDEKKLEDKIQQLEKDLADARAKLKALREKSKKP